MKFIIGKKVEMTQIWSGDDVKPVTKVALGTCTVLQVKTQETDGYNAVQLGYGDRKAKNINKAQIGHFKKMGNFAKVREFRLDNQADSKINQANVELAKTLKAGDQIDASAFSEGERVTLIGASKGKGFAGVVKRHGFHGQDASHGNKDQLRASGSVGAGGVQHVFKGTRMGGRMGGLSVTVHDAKILKIEDNILYILGQVPGARNGLILIEGEGELKIKAQGPITNDQEETKIENVEEVKEEIKEEVKTEEVKAE